MTHVGEGGGRMRRDSTQLVEYCTKTCVCVRVCARAARGQHDKLQITFSIQDNKYIHLQCIKPTL